jgi:ABC-type transporter Mla subunit MlaD
MKTNPRNPQWKFFCSQQVLVNDIQAHQTSVDTLNDAGRQIIESGKGTAEASATQEKLSQLNRHWRDLLAKAADRQHELEDALREAQRFHAEIQDLLSWLGDVDGVIAASKPVGGLPETASEQLERFMVLHSVFILTCRFLTRHSIGV